MRKELDLIGASLGVRQDDLSAWYKVSVVDIIKNGGKHLFLNSKYELFPLLREAYPEHSWEAARFSSTGFQVHSPVLSRQLGLSDYFVNLLMLYYISLSICPFSRLMLPLNTNPYPISSLLLHFPDAFLASSFPIIPSKRNSPSTGKALRCHI